MLKILDIRKVMQNGYSANNFTSHLITRDDTRIATMQCRMRRSAFQYDGIKIADKIPDNPAGGEFLPVTNNKERSDAVCPRRAHFPPCPRSSIRMSYIGHRSKCHILDIDQNATLQCIAMQCPQWGHIWPYGHRTICKKIWASEVSLERAIKM